MYFDKRVQTEFVRHRQQLAHVGIAQCRHDQKDTVSTNNPGLVDLIDVDSEILAQHRQRTGLPRLAQMGVGALKEVSIGQNRETGSAVALVATRYFGRVKVSD